MCVKKCNIGHPSDIVNSNIWVCQSRFKIGSKWSRKIHLCVTICRIKVHDVYMFFAYIDIFFFVKPYFHTKRYFVWYSLFICQLYFSYHFYKYLMLYIRLAYQTFILTCRALYYCMTDTVFALNNFLLS